MDRLRAVRALFPMRWLVFPLVLMACVHHTQTGDDTQDTADADDTADVTTADDAAAPDEASTIDVAPPPPTTSVSIIVEPDGKNGQQIVDAISAAKKSVHMTMYILSSTDVINALIARHKAGVDVKVVLDSSTQTDNASVYNQLKAAGVGVAWSVSTFTYTHEKCFIVDGAVAWIMTMNLASSPPSSNREYLAIDTTPTDVAEAEAIFEGDYARTPLASVSGALVVAPINALTMLTGLISTAKTSIDIEAEELSDYHTADALKAALGRGVAVRVVLSDATQTTAGQQAVAEVKGAGGKLVVLSTPYVHAKTMIIDKTTAYVGSENFSTGSLEYNRELGVVFSVASEVTKIESTIATDFGKGTAL